MASILELSKTIADAVNALDSICKKNGTSVASLDEPFTPHCEAFRADPLAAESANIIAAAALQLAATVLPTPNVLYSLVAGSLKSAAIRVCLEANVTEILREAGPEGLHVNEIARKATISSTKLARLLRYLATHHIYKELRPDVFTNTRISTALDSGKSVEDIQANPDAKHDGTQGLAALAGHHLDEAAKTSVYLWENMKDPKTAFSDEANEGAFNRAYNIDTTFWEWLETPAEANRFRRFGTGMQGVAALEPVDAIVTAFDWASLPADSVVVDVGGGVGTSSLPLAEHFPKLNLVIQDRPSVIKDAKKLWEGKMPNTLETGRVKLAEHDFFTPQPVQNASVFLLKQILHDWADTYSVKILSHLRKAAQPHTKLLLIDSIMPYACHYPGSDDIQGAVPHEAPSPLLANYGGANDMSYIADMTMLMLLNSQERTINHLKELLQITGWKLTKVVRDGAKSFLQPVIAEPL